MCNGLYAYLHFLLLQASYMMLLKVLKNTTDYHKIKVIGGRNQDWYFIQTPVTTSQGFTQKYQILSTLTRKLLESSTFSKPITLPKKVCQQNRSH